MTQETPVEPLERRILNGVGALLAVVFWWLMLSQWLERIPGPEAVYDNLAERVHERRRWRAAMLSTLDDIADLPEADLEPIGDIDLGDDDEEP